MGTVVEQIVFGRHARHIARTVSRETARLERLWSVYRPSSEIARLRACAGRRPVRVHPDTAAVLALAHEIRELTLGAFDIAAAPLVRLWRNAEPSGAAPSETDIASAIALLTGHPLELDGRRAYLPLPGQELDLGGIGKGFAADRAAEIYRKYHTDAAMINLGGNVMVTGRKPDGSPWRIGILDPASDDGGCVGWVEADECSVVTSGGYRRFFQIGGEFLPHIIDPRTGRPAVTDIAGVTIVSSCSARADALATAVYVLGAERGLALIEGLPDAEAVIIGNGGEVLRTASPDFKFYTNR
ncbi:MAG: FAD:protein FMN transferase [Brevinematales bacterium]|nr:FAD:protein FMN transferase [Brevinematales bacterium]